MNQETIEDGKYVFFLEGRISQENAGLVEHKLQDFVKMHPNCDFILDAQKLEYISSAGLRAILKVIQKGVKITIKNATDMVYSTLEMTGFTELVHVEKSLRHISTDNCKILGAGRSSVVYQIDSESIVKKYDKHVSIELVRREMNQARQAFVSGIPTAIPFDIVRADDSYGLVFEQIAPAITVGKAIQEHMERFDEITGKYTELLKQIHHTHIGEKTCFLAEKDIWLGWVEGMKPYYSEEEIEFLRLMVSGIPDRKTMVHCDFHENNVLVFKGNLILIDMADIGYGHPIFDLAGGAFRAHASLIPGRKAHHGFSAEDMQLFWKTVLRYYFDTEDTEKLHKIQDMCYAFGLVRSALFPMKHVHINDELRQLHINDVRENLFPRQDWALQQLENLSRFFRVSESG